MTSIQAPTHCPCCESALVWINHLLYCQNPTCGSQAQKKLEHFAKTLKIKGLGPSSIEKLGIYGIEDVYQLSQERIAECLSSEKLAEKLYAEIQNSKAASLNLVLPAFSITLIGRTATEKLSKVCNHITEISEETCEKAGLGPKATANLLDWLVSDFYSYYDGLLPFDYKFKQATPVAAQGTVCISGKLKSFKTKAEATTALKAAGFDVKSSLTKEVTILINESGIESSKTQKARESGVTIVTNLIQFLENL